MLYWIIVGSIFLILEVIALLSFTPLKNKYEFFDFIHDCYADESIGDISSVGYTITAALIALLFPLVIVFIVSYFISCFIVFILKKFKRKN